MIIDGNLVMPNSIYENSEKLIFLGDTIELDTFENKGEIDLKNKKITLKIKNINGIKGIILDNVEDLTFIGTESFIDLTYLTNNTPRLSKLTIDSCKGLANTQENLIACDHLLSKKIVISVINMFEFEDGYVKYLNAFPKPIQSEIDFRTGPGVIETPINEERVVRTLDFNPLDFNQRNLESGAITINPNESGPLFITVNPDRFVNQLCGYTMLPQSISNTEGFDRPQPTSIQNTANSLIGFLSGNE